MRRPQSLQICLGCAIVLVALFGMLGCIPPEEYAFSPSGSTPGRVPGRPGGTAGLQLKPSGSLTIIARASAGSFSWTWDLGVLTLANESVYEFRISGLDVVAVGVRQVTVVGHAYRLSKLQDFEGKYFNVSTDQKLGSRVSAVMIENNRGVTISIRGVDQGVSFNLSEWGVTISNLKKRK